MLQKSQGPTTWHGAKTFGNNGRFQLPTNLNWCVWLPSTLSPSSKKRKKRKNPQPQPARECPRKTSQQHACQGAVEMPKDSMKAPAWCFLVSLRSVLEPQFPQKSGAIYQWLFLVPLKGEIGGIVHPPIGRKNTTYIPLIVLAFWEVICYLSPLIYRRHPTGSFVKWTPKGARCFLDPLEFHDKFER